MKKFTSITEALSNQGKIEYYQMEIMLRHLEELRINYISVSQEWNNNNDFFSEILSEQYPFEESFDDSKMLNWLNLSIKKLKDRLNDKASSEDIEDRLVDLIDDGLIKDQVFVINDPSKVRRFMSSNIQGYDSVYSIVILLFGRNSENQNVDKICNLAADKLKGPFTIISHATRLINSLPKIDGMDHLNLPFGTRCILMVVDKK